MAEDAKVLEGVRVIDWTTMAAGPGASAVLADFGADVIKIEPPSGDPWRKVMAPAEGRSFGAPFQHDNRGKRSVKNACHMRAAYLACCI